ncbi:MAG: iron ABC transporter permease [Pseudomonadota bacterium]
MARALFFLASTAAILFVVGLHVGVRFTSPDVVLAALFDEAQDASGLIVQNLRLPRGILALFVGASLGLSGLLMQCLMRNQIAEPGLLGVNAGAAFAVVCLLSVYPASAISSVIAAAAIGAAAATALVLTLSLATGGGLSPIFLLLAGVTIAALLNAGLQVLIILDEAVMEELLFWLAGAFVDRPIEGLWIVVVLVGLAVLLTWRFQPALDVMSTDDATATTLGVDVAKMRLIFLGIAALLAGACVAFAGPIAFVGLVAPHLARLTGARGMAQLVPLSVLWGVNLALAADLLARFVLYPSEVPVSAVLAVIGVPTMLFLLKRRRLLAT